MPPPPGCNSTTHLTVRYDPSPQVLATTASCPPGSEGQLLQSHASLAPRTLDSCPGNPSFLSGSRGHPLASPIMFLTSVSGHVKFLPVSPFLQTHTWQYVATVMGLPSGGGGGERRGGCWASSLAKECCFSLPSTPFPGCSERSLIKPMPFEHGCVPDTANTQIRCHTQSSVGTKPRLTARK